LIIFSKPNYFNVSIEDMLPAGVRHNFPVLPFQIFRYPELASTNQTLWEWLSQRMPEATTVVADRQTAGRGQWGRQWQSNTGGLYLSVGLTPHTAIENTPQLTLCSAWGIATILQQVGIPVALKWPNDLVLYGRKLGGILTQTRIANGKVVQAVVGIGINWSNPVPEPGISLTACWSQTHWHPIESLEQLMAVTLVGVSEGYQRWRNGDLRSLVTDYESLLIHLGDSVAINERDAVVLGVTLGGQLRVRWCDRVGEGETHLHPGEVTLGYA
jgi:BirA family biotin operon repressor/biotin-[acetyl-CoA-carboxylase] ligase